MINFMRYSDTPYLTDLLATSLRWLALFGLTISLAIGGVLAPANQPGALLLTVLLLGLLAVWNGFVSALAMFNRRLGWHRRINVGMDLVFALAIFVHSGGLYGPAVWIALLPLFSGAVYFETRGAFTVAVLMSVIQTTYLSLQMGSSFHPTAIGLIVGMNFIGAALVALLSGPLIRRLRKSYQSTVILRREGERKAQRLERDRMRALFEMIETFSATLNYQTVMETVLETAAAALEDRDGAANSLAGAVMLFSENKGLQISAARNFLSDDTAASLPGEEGALEQTMKSGEARLLWNPGTDPELSKLKTMQGQKAVLCLPLIRGMNAYGVMVFAHTNPDFFTPERIETLQMLSNQAVIALQNARLYHDLAREKERIVQMQDEAQKKLARDLHDGPTQSVSAIAMRVSLARRMLERSPGEAAEELVKIEELARRTTQEIRHMLFTLRPLVLESEGLEPALHTMAEKMGEIYQQRVLVNVEEGVVARLDANRQTVIFFLAEEAANNARKHAQASEIHIQLQCVPKLTDIALLEVSDNGVGFDVSTIMDTYDRRGSMGMINLRERADLINGLLKIDSAPGKGTRIRVFIPLTDAASDRLHQRRQES